MIVTIISSSSSFSILLLSIPILPDVRLFLFSSLGTDPAKSSELDCNPNHKKTVPLEYDISVALLNFILLK
jgi:hypothetical protein